MYVAASVARREKLTILMALLNRDQSTKLCLKGKRWHTVPQGHFIGAGASGKFLVCTFHLDVSDFLITFLIITPPFNHW